MSDMAHFLALVSMFLLLFLIGLYRFFSKKRRKQKSENEIDPTEIMDTNPNNKPEVDAVTNPGYSLIKGNIWHNMFHKRD